MNESGTLGEQYEGAIHDGGCWRGAVVIMVFSLLGLGFVYSLAGVGLGQTLFPRKAAGSLVAVNGRVVGSALVAQWFESPQYFRARPSAANYDPMAAAGSNQARSNPALLARLAAEATAVAAREGVAAEMVQAGLVTQSGSGLDPELSPAAARQQAARVATTRGIALDEVLAMIDATTTGRSLGFLGEPRVNVLVLNIALDARVAGR